MSESRTACREYDEEKITEIIIVLEESLNGKWRKTSSFFAGYLKEYSRMNVADFESIDKNGLTMLQMIAYNYVLESKSDTKTADKIMSIIKKDEGLLKDW